MANFEAVTACNGCKLNNVKGVRKYMDKFQFCIEDSTEGIGIDSDGTFRFYGYGWPSIYAIDDVGFDDDVSNSFYSGLRKFVPKGKKLMIHMIGHEKCRYPLSMQCIIITSKKVEYMDLPC